MVVDISNDKYYVRWTHIQESALAPHTICDVTQRDAIVDGEYRSLGKGVAKMYYKDKTFKKDLGRKISLEKVLRKLFPNPCDKPARTAFWEAYYKMRNNKW
jgi:hypothetical protein